MSETAAETPEPQPHRAGFIGIVGRPNAGKSTLINRLVGEEVAIATPKPQTTRDRIRGIRSFDGWQAIFVDTPGIHEARTRLNRYMVDLAVSTLSEVDLVYLLLDAPKWQERPDKHQAETRRIVEHIEIAKTPTILVLNKVDKVKDKAKLLSIIDAARQLHDFVEIVPVSALRGGGCEGLLATTRRRLPEGPALYEADALTDRPLRFVVKELIREPLIMQLGQELPYNLAVTVDAWQERPTGALAIHASIHVARKSHKPIIVGKGGSRIKKVGQAARHRIEQLLERPGRVYLDLRVKVDERWVDRPDKLRELGYDER